MPPPDTSFARRLWANPADPRMIGRRPHQPAVLAKRAEVDSPLWVSVSGSQGRFFSRAASPPDRLGLQQDHCPDARCRLDSKRTAFSLVELLVVTGVLGLMMALVLPNLSAVRQSMMSATAVRYLQGFGKGFLDHASSDRRGRFCSGAYDHLRDGDIRYHSWVGDLISARGEFKPGHAIDPVNENKLSEETAIYIGGIDGTGKVNPRRWSGKKTVTGTAVDLNDASTMVGRDYFGTTGNLWDQSFNTNFAATWYFCRGDCIGTGTDVNPIDEDPSRCPLDGDGPLSTAHLGDSRFLTQAVKVPLLGPAAGSNADTDQGTSPSGGTLTLSQALTINDFIDPLGRKRVVRMGDGVCEGMTDGPAADIVAETITPFGGNGDQAVHSFRDISPLHKAKPGKVQIENDSGGETITQLVGGYAPVLFADGHVAKVYDAKGSGGRRDGWLGPYRKDDGWTLDQGAIDEVRDALWLGRLRAAPTAGGGSLE